MSKCKFQEDDDQPMLRIRLADQAGEPLQAEQFRPQLLQAVPPPAIRQRGVGPEQPAHRRPHRQPVPREIVVTWLNKAHCTAYGRGAVFQQQEPDPCKTFTGLYQLLTFADAVDSTKALLNTCVAQLDGLQLQMQLGEQWLQLDTDGRVCYHHPSELLQLVAAPLTAIDKVGSPAVNESDVAAFRAQAAAQTEQLLFMAYKLQLAALIERLHAFVAACMPFPGSIFTGQEQAVFSGRMLDAAVGINRLGRQAWVDSILHSVAPWWAGR